MSLTAKPANFYYYSRDLKPHETVQIIYQRIKADKYSILLESSNTYLPKTSEFSIISVFPEMLLTLRHDDLTIKHLDKDNDFKRHIQIKSVSKLLTILQEVLDSCKVNADIDEVSHLPFLGGLLGYISYDFIRLIEKLPEKNIPQYIPDLEFIVTKSAVIFDHKENKIWVITDDKKKLDYLTSRINLNLVDRLTNIRLKRKEEKRFSFTEEEFIKQVDKTKEYIAQGEIYQANISIQFSQLMELSPFDFYKELYKRNPSPFCSFIHFDDFSVICNSPERLVRSYPDKTVETRPIAGTRGRSKDQKEDQRLEDEMISSAKERSEHIMLVDLERNDLGKVSEYGTVEVDELFTVEKYSHVMHLVSNVRCKLDEKYDCLDLIPAMFPGGTITGVPKIRCMEIIEELEPCRRGLYTGSIGYIDFRGSMDLNIVIRTMTLEQMRPENYYVKMQFGAGIVADSVGKHEYKECIKKGMAIFDLLSELS